jgi:hypothetical protein
MQEVALRFQGLNATWQKYFLRCYGLFLLGHIKAISEQVQHRPTVAPLRQLHEMTETLVAIAVAFERVHSTERRLGSRRVEMRLVERSASFKFLTRNVHWDASIIGVADEVHNDAMCDGCRSNATIQTQLFAKNHTEIIS